MGRLKKTQADIIEEIKSADWKIVIAAALKCKTSATNVWIADKLNMGVPHAVSRYTGIFKQNEKDNDTPFLALIANITTCPEWHELKGRVGMRPNLNHTLNPNLKALLLSGLRTRIGD
jgi:hypothetical protein